MTEMRRLVRRANALCTFISWRALMRPALVAAAVGALVAVVAS